MREITQEEAREALGLQDDGEGLPTHSSVSRAICRAVERWQIAPKARVLSHVKEQLRAVGLDSGGAGERVSEVYDRLTTIGVVEAVQLAGRAHCARAEPRWIRLCEDLAVLTGTTSDMNIAGTSAPGSGDPMGTLMTRFDPEDLDTLAALQALDINEWRLDEWRGDLGYVEHLVRRAPTCETPTLSAFWKTLEDALTDDGALVSDDAEVRAVVGEPGEYFGRGTGPNPDGRWTDAPPDGVWCGVRKGYSESHWRRVLLDVRGAQRRVLDLYDMNEWCWALLARGEFYGTPERAERQGDTVSFSHPLPDDLIRLMLLVSEGRDGWTWTVPERMPAVWELP